VLGRITEDKFRSFALVWAKDKSAHGPCYLVTINKSAILNC
jgi:hypothetical protein